MDNKPKAIILMLIAALAFAIMGAMVKLSGDIPLFEKVFYRNLISLAMAYFMIRKSKMSFFGKGENQKYLISRSLLGLLGVVLSFYALNNLVLSDANMLNKISPFFVTLFAAVFLKEKLSKIQIPVLIIVFTGALLIIKPQFSLTGAYRYAPAAEVSIYDYTSIVFSAIIGFIIWSEIPDVLSIIGTLLIILAAVFMFTYNKKRVFQKKI